nr:hypothetical protein [Myxococcota bacterium]
MRAWVLLSVIACSSPESRTPSRLDPLLATHGLDHRMGGTPETAPREPRSAPPAGAPAAATRDGKDRDLERKLRDVAT